MLSVLLFCFFMTMGHGALLYPDFGITVFYTSTHPLCTALGDSGPYRGRSHQLLAPQLNTCYKCSGKAIKYENLNPYSSNKGGNIRQCVNLNNDCGGAFTCTDIPPNSCVQHPCISGDVVYGKWILYQIQGYLVQPFDDLSCDASSSRPPPYFYPDTSDHCAVFDNTTKLVPNNPKCVKWSSQGDENNVQVCTSAERACNATSVVIINDSSCDVNGASCTDYAVNSIDATGTCVSGSGWPFLGSPKAKVQYVEGNPLFVDTRNATSAWQRAVELALVLAASLLLVLVIVL